MKTFIKQEKNDRISELEDAQIKNREDEIENNGKLFDLEKEKNDLERKYQQLFENNEKEKNDLNTEISRLKCNIQDLKDKLLDVSITLYIFYDILNFFLFLK